MATSGTITYSMTARDVITQALLELRVGAIGEAPAGEYMTQGISSLNRMLKSWQLTGPNLWRQTEGSVTVTSATSSFTLSPRPHRIFECRFRDTAGTDLPMEEMTRDEYFELPQKSSAGTPTSYYFDPQRSSGTLYVWPVLATAAGETFKYTYQRVFEDISSPNNNLDIPQECLDTVVLNLADRMQGVFGKDNRDLRQRAALSFMQLSDADREPVVRFIPGR